MPAVRLLNMQHGSHFCGCEMALLKLVSLKMRNTISKACPHVIFSTWRNEWMQWHKLYLHLEKNACTIYFRPPPEWVLAHHSHYPKFRALDESLALPLHCHSFEPSHHHTCTFAFSSSAPLHCHDPPWLRPRAAQELNQSSCTHPCCISSNRSSSRLGWEALCARARRMTYSRHRYDNKIM